MSISSAATIAAMQDISSPSKGDVVEVAGHASTDDGGGGTFFFDTTHITRANVKSANITGATYNNGPAPIVITAVAHPFVDGQAVLVAGVDGNTNANGVWLVERLDPDTFALLGSRGNAAYTPGDAGKGGTATSVTVTTSAAHGLCPGGRAVIERVIGVDGFDINDSYLPIGTTDARTFTLGAAPTGRWGSGGAVGDGGTSFPTNPPPPVPSTHLDGRWVRRRDDTELNARWFGAVGDGQADDTEHLIATIRASRTLKAGVYLPAGNFRITEEIRLESLNVTGYSDLGLSVRGEGSEEVQHGGTRLTAGRDGMRSILSIHSHRVSLAGLSFGCAHKADHGLYLQGASTLHLDEVHVEHAVKDAYRLAGTNDAGQATINDNVYARRLSADKCGTMYCSSSDLIESRYGNLRATKLIEGTVSCEAGQETITGSGTKFTEIPARPGDFILIGTNNDSALQRLEIAEIVDDRQIKVYTFLKPSLNLSNQPFAIGVGDGWSEESHNDNSRARMDVGKIRYCAGSGIVCRGMYGPMIDNMELQGCGFAGIVIGTFDSEIGVFLSTRITSPYFEGTFYGGCILLAQARGITIDEPMWFGQPADHRLFVSETASANARVLGYLADFVDSNHAIGLRPLGAAITDIPASRGSNLVNDGTLSLPSAGKGITISRSPWITPIPISARNINISMDRNLVDAAVDVTAAPTFLAGADGQEIAVCNVTPHPITFHDGRKTNVFQTSLGLDCEPGGTVSLNTGQIMMLYYSISGSMNGKWWQRGAVATSIPNLTSLAPTMASAAGGDSITLTGANLTKATTVRVSGSRLEGGSGEPFGTITENTASSVTFRMPARNAGRYNVLVTTARGASNLLSIEVR